MYFATPTQTQEFLQCMHVHGFRDTLYINKENILCCDLRQEETIYKKQYYLRICQHNGLVNLQIESTSTNSTYSTRV